MKTESKIEWTDFTFNPDDPVTYVQKQGRVVPGYSCYCVTHDGRVWTRYRRGGRGRTPGPEWFEKKPCATKKGHLRVELTPYPLPHGNGGRPKKFYVHVLVLELFVGHRPEGMEACHTDGNPTNNHVSNLRWDTPQGNWADRKRHGRGCEGEKNPGGGKLTTSEVEAIRTRRADGELLRNLAADFGVSTAMISKITRGEAWCG